MTRIVQWAVGVVVLSMAAFPREGSAWIPFAYDRGNFAYQKRDYGSAAGFYNDILERNPQEPKVHYNLGNTYYRMGRFEEAEKEFLSALQTSDSPLRDLSLYNLGNARFRKGDLEGAVASYNKALEINPGNEKAKLNRDYVLRLLEQKKKEEEKKPREPEKESDEKEEPERTDPQNSQEKEEGQKTAEDEEKKEGAQEQEEPKEKKGEEGQEKPKEKEALQGTPGPSERPMSPEEREAVLESLEDDPKGAIRDMLVKEQEGKRSPAEKDW